MTDYDDLVRKAAAARRCSWSVPEENHPDGGLCRMEGHCIDTARAMLDAAGVPDLLARQGRDEYHTMDELYEYRMLYNAHAAQGWMAATFPVVKSWRHSDGELCFGGGWFIVVATLPTGQVANHYRAEHWDLFDVPVVDLPPAYDGHTPAVAADRLRASVTP